MTTQITQAGGCWKIWSWKYACDACGVSSVFEQQTGHCHHSAGRKTNPLTWGMPFLDVHLHIRTHMYSYVRLIESDAWSHPLTYATMNNTLTVLTVHVASQLSAHTVCKSLCHLSTFQQDCLKGDSHAPFLPPSFFSLSPSFSLLLPPLCLCPWWPSCWVVCLTALTLALGLT